MRVLVVDCYDSFTYNLCQQIGVLGGEPVVVRNDVPIREVEGLGCDRILLSPGPGRPEESGLCLDVLAAMSPDIPTLGVCLGHQAICTAFGGGVKSADHLMHGMTSEITHDGEGVFHGMSSPFTATRYHSLVGDQESMPPDLKVTAVSLDDGCVMAVRHRRFPIEGVQFHPESILCSEGDRLIRNFLFQGSVL